MVHPTAKSTMLILYITFASQSPSRETMLMQAFFSLADLTGWGVPCVLRVSGSKPLAFVRYMFLPGRSVVSVSHSSQGY